MNALVWALATPSPARPPAAPAAQSGGGLSTVLLVVFIARVLLVVVLTIALRQRGRADTPSSLHASTPAAAASGRPGAPGPTLGVATASRPDGRRTPRPAAHRRARRSLRGAAVSNHRAGRAARPPAGGGAAARAGGAVRAS